MNYKRIHDSIIERAKNRKLDSYTEKHHIIPKCMNGTNDSTNLVELTAREHFIVHKLLCEIYPKEHKLLYAYWAMTCGWKNGEHIREYKISSREYERLRERYSNVLSEEKVKLYKQTEHPFLGRYHSDSSKEKMKIAQERWLKANGHPRGMLGKTHSEEMKKQWSKERSGKNHWNYGGNFSKKTRRKQSEAAKRRIEDPNERQRLVEMSKEYHKNNDVWNKGIKEKTVKCPYCNKVGGNAVMKRWHFENCKENI